jgi:hypothetical protein
MALSGVRRDVFPDVAAARSALDVRSDEQNVLLSLAELLVSGVPALPPGERQDPDHAMSAWINVELLFEEAVRTIAQEMVGHGGRVRAGRGDGVLLFQARDEDPRMIRKSADPDVVIRQGETTLLLDAKYRRHEEDFTEAELYQLMAHAGAYQALAAALVAPSRDGGGPHERFIGRDRNGVTYYVIFVNPASQNGMREPMANWISRQIRQPQATLLPSGP